MSSTITINKTAVQKELEVALYKYATAIEVEGKDKAIHNIKSDRVDDTADALLLDNSFDKRIKEVASSMRDFNATISVSGTDSTITFDISSRWLGSVVQLASLVKAYILDGMMADWCEKTVPSEAPKYANRLPEDARLIRKELYSVGKPAIA